MHVKQKVLMVTLEILDTILNIVITLAIVFFIRSFIFSPFLISGVSMFPTLDDKEYILVNKITYGNVFGKELGSPQRGDIVVVKAPIPNKSDPVYYIKRVVGLPGETIYFKENEVYIKNEENPNGFKVEEPYIRCNQERRECSDYNNTSYDIPMENFWVMGDNRDQSTDSRSCFYSCNSAGSTHFVKRDEIIGKSSVVLWPFTHARFIENKRNEE